MQEIKIIVDNRERNVDLIAGLERNGILVEYAQVPAGDYILSDRICVERKTISDFESSIISSHLFEQLERLKLSFEKPFLLIEDNGEEFRLGYNVMLGATLKVFLDYGVQVIVSSGAENTADILSKLAKREQEDSKKEPRLVGIKKAHSTSQWQSFMLSSIPGIGTKLARSLLSHFKTIKNIANAQVEELTKVSKIGKKKAEKIHEILNKEYLDHN